MKSYMLSNGMKTSDFVNVERTIEQHLTQESIEKTANGFLNTFNDKMLEIKDSFLVTCFTQTFKNDNLWQTYAKNYTGFCIEYDLLKAEVETHDNLLFQITPMLYGRKTPINFVELFRIAKMEYCKEDYDKSLAENMDVQFNSN